VDRNANGDLTDDGAPFTGDFSFRIPDVGGKDGKTKYTDLRLNWGPRAVTGGDPEVNLYLRLRVGDLEQYTFVKARATDPDKAPVIHFDGPLQIELRIQPYKPQEHLTRGKEHLLGGSICTRYPGVEWVGVSHEKGIPADIHPTFRYYPRAFFLDLSSHSAYLNSARRERHPPRAVPALPGQRRVAHRRSAAVRGPARPTSDADDAPPAR
jgi:hypothetical protein